MNKSKSISNFFKPSLDSGKLRDQWILMIGASLAGVFILSLAMFNFFVSMGPQEAKLILAFDPNSRERMFVGEVVSNMTILDVLTVSAEAGSLDIQYVVDTNGKTKIFSLDGYSLDNSGKRLIFSINGDPIDESVIHLKKVNPGDTVKVGLK